MFYSKSLNKALHRIMENDIRVHLLGEDICDPYGGAFKVTKGLSTKFPDRVINMPISESAITGIATGMAMRGLIPIVEIMFSDFLTLCADQIINGATKFTQIFNMEIPLLIRTPSGGHRGYGPTHSQSLESLFFNVPNLQIIAPSIYHSPGKMLEEVVSDLKIPTLFIEDKVGYGKQVVCFPFSKTQAETDITIITYGSSVDIAVEAQEIVSMSSEEDINAHIVNLSAIYPIKDIHFNTADKIIIVEEGRGWGNMVAARIYEERFNTLSCPIVIIQARDSVIPCAKHLERNVLPQVSDIVKAIYAIA